MVADLDAVAVDGPRRQLRNLVCPPDERDQPEPGRQPPIGLDDLTLVVDEHGIDREAHEHHVDPIATMNQEAAVFGQPGAEHQPQPAGEEVLRDLEGLRNNGAVRFC